MKTKAFRILQIRRAAPLLPAALFAMVAVGLLVGFAAADPAADNDGPRGLAATMSSASSVEPESGAARHLSRGSDFEFVGSRECRRCHLKEYRSWEKSPHAAALDLLEPGERFDAKEAAGLDPDADYTEDPECLECHSVGFGDETGFESRSSSRTLVGVGCESCHGPGSEYGTESAMGPKNKNHSFESVIAKGLVYPVPEEVCANCHNERSPFNAALDAKYALEYSPEVLETATHDHVLLKNDHGDLPPGVLFQKKLP